MQTEKIRVRRRIGGRVRDVEVEVPSPIERERIAKELHAEGKVNRHTILDCTVYYKPRWTFTGHTEKYDPFNPKVVGAKDPFTTISEACCSFSVGSEWSDCFSWFDGDHAPPTRRGHGNATPEPGASDSEQAEAAPDNAASPDTFLEGLRRRVESNSYERSQRARALCLEHYGARCFICGYTSFAAFGDEAPSCIHVHHLELVSAREGCNSETDPIRDMRPLCPNCHYFVHTQDPPIDVEKAKELHRAAGGGERLVPALDRKPTRPP